MRSRPERFMLFDCAQRSDSPAPFPAAEPLADEDPDAPDAASPMPARKLLPLASPSELVPIQPCFPPALTLTQAPSRASTCTLSPFLRVATVSKPADFPVNTLAWSNLTVASSAMAVVEIPSTAAAIIHRRRRGMHFMCCLICPSRCRRRPTRGP